MVEGIMDSMKDWMVLILAGLGITFAPHEFWGGIFMALGAAMAARHWMPEKDQREIKVVLTAAFILAVFTAELVSWLRSPEMAMLPQNFPIQLAMATTGFASRFIIRFALRVAGRLEEKSEQITDNLLEKHLGKLDADNKEAKK